MMLPEKWIYIMSIIYANQIKYQKSRQRLLLPADVTSVMRTNRGVNMDHGHFIQDLNGRQRGSAS